MPDISLTIVIHFFVLYLSVDIDIIRGYRKYNVPCIYACCVINIILLGFVSRTSTVKATWRISSFTGGGRPWLPLCTLLVYQLRTGTREESPTFRSLIPSSL